jgi:GntR family transcriptional regulator
MFLCITTLILMSSTLPLQVTPSSGVAIYRQLVDQVRAQIAGGRLGTGEFLPSVRRVAEDLQINPMTVSKAYSILERDGLLDLVRGQGMRVASMRAAANGKIRRDVLGPLLNQVAVAAKQLSLSPRQVIEELKPLLEEIDHD